MKQFESVLFCFLMNKITKNRVTSCGYNGVSVAHDGLLTSGVKNVCQCYISGRLK